MDGLVDRDARWLYERYRDALVAAGSEPDPAWPYLPDVQRAAWTTLARVELARRAPDRPACEVCGTD